MTNFTNMTVAGLLAAVCGAGASGNNCNEWTLMTGNALPQQVDTGGQFAGAPIAAAADGAGVLHILMGTQSHQWLNRWFTWNGALLAEQLPPGGVSIASGAGAPMYSMYFDAARQKLVVLANEFFYELNGGSWDAVGSAFLPTDGCRAVYDAVQNTAFVTKGSHTFLFDGQTLTTLNPALKPPGRVMSGLVFDASRGVIVFHGGYSGNPLGDTWEWVAGRWSQNVTGAAPTPAHSFSMSYDPTTQRVVRQGGIGAGGVILDETWVYDGAGWSLAAGAGPAPKAKHASAFDPNSGQLIMVGGNIASDGSEMWTLDEPFQIVYPPQNIPTVNPGDYAAFVAYALGDDVTYQWEEQGSGPVDGGFGPALLFPNVTPADAGIYRCVISSPCGTIVTNWVSLGVYLPHPGDVDGDGDTDFADLNLLLSFYNTGGI